MVDTVRTLSALQTLLADNTAGDISAQDVRDMLVSVYPVVKAKPSGESLASNTTLQNDDDLFLEVAANEVWIARFVLILDCTSATPDIKTRVDGPSGSTGWFQTWGLAPATTGVEASAKIQGFALGANSPSVGIPDTSITGTVSAQILAYISNGATPGNLQLLWAQNATSTSAITVGAGSHMIAHRVNS